MAYRNGDLGYLSSEALNDLGYTSLDAMYNPENTYYKDLTGGVSYNGRNLDYKTDFDSQDGVFRYGQSKSGDWIIARPEEARYYDRKTWKEVSRQEGRASSPAYGQSGAELPGNRSLKEQGWVVLAREGSPASTDAAEKPAYQPDPKKAERARLLAEQYQKDRDSYETARAGAGAIPAAGGSFAGGFGSGGTQLTGFQPEAPGVIAGTQAGFAKSWDEYLKMQNSQNQAAAASLNLGLDKIVAGIDPNKIKLPELMDPGDLQAYTYNNARMFGLT